MLKLRRGRVLSVEDGEANRVSRFEVQIEQVPEAMGAEDASFEAFFAAEWARLFRAFPCSPEASREQGCIGKQDVIPALLDPGHDRFVQVDLLQLC